MKKTIRGFKAGIKGFFRALEPGHYEAAGRQVASPPVLQLPTWSDLPGYEPGSIRPVLTGSEWFSPVLTRAATSGNPKATKPQLLAALRSYSPQKYRLGSAARLLKAG